MEPSLKRIVCLSRSRKMGGFCFAGKEISENNVIGDWIRPVSSRESEEISSNECEYQDGCKPELLDIVEIPIVKHKPTCHQCENYLIDDLYYWSNKGAFHRKNLKLLCDSPKALWEPHDSSYYGINNRVHECYMDGLKDSLFLITPSSLNVEIQTEGKEFGNPARKIRAEFKYNGKIYLLPITDPDIEKKYYKKKNGRYIFDNPEGKIFLCVSIGLPWKEYCYKFVASIIK